MYEEIRAITHDEVELKDEELRALASVWRERRGELEKTGHFSEFIKKLQREWAIETGIIERLYTWDRGITEVLIERGIEGTVISHQTGMSYQEAESVASVISDQLNIVDGLFKFVKGETVLTEHYIRSMHQQFTAHQDTVDALTHDRKIIKIPLLKGEYKKSPNNPLRPDGTLHEYCPPEFVVDEMQRLIKWFHEAEMTSSAEVLAAWLHHRFTQIHPFQDGNGRIARALASLVFIKLGMFPLVIRESDRVAYINALEEADKGELGPLVQLFSARQRDAILRAIGLEQQVKQAGYADEILNSALRLLKDKSQQREVKISEELDKFSQKLMQFAYDRLQEIESTLREGFQDSAIGNSAYWVTTAHALNGSVNDYYYYKQIIEIAQRIDYYANMGRYKAWAVLKIHAEKTFEYVISFHAYGYGLTGIISVSAFTSQRFQNEDGISEYENPKPACTDLFQFNYAEPIENIEKRFKEWFESSLAIGLAEWKKTLEI